MADDWPWADVERLKALWETKHSTAEIGRLMGRTKPSIVGKAHRLDLPARPNFIGMTGEARREALGQDRLVTTPHRPQAPRKAAPRLFPNVDRARSNGLVGGETRAREVREAGYREAGLITAPRPHRPFSSFTAAPTHYPAEMGCQWIHGDVDKPGWRFCEAVRETARPYCPAHCQLAYASAWRREAEAA